MLKHDHLPRQARDKRRASTQKEHPPLIILYRSGGTNQACIKHYTPLGTPEKCIFAQYVFPFISSSIFGELSLSDEEMIDNLLCQMIDNLLCQMIDVTQSTVLI